MTSRQTTGAGKGAVYRKVDRQSFTDNHSYIFGILPSYLRDPSGVDCALRGRSQGKCWGDVQTQAYPAGPSQVCRGHAEYFLWFFNKPEAREYIPENTTT